MHDPVVLRFFAVPPSRRPRRLGCGTRAEPHERNRSRFFFPMPRPDPSHPSQCGRAQKHVSTTWRVSPRPSDGGGSVLPAPLAAMAARPAPVAARGEARALRASRAPSRAPRRRARRGGAVSRADPGDGVPSSAHDSIAPDMFGASPGPRSSALHRAARRGDLERVRRLLETRAHDVNEADANGSTALMWACQFGRDDVVEALLRRGADARARNKFNWSALEYASTSSLAGDVLFALLPWYFTGVVSRRRTSQTETHESNALAFDADASSLRTRETVAAAALSGAYGALLGDWSRYVEHDDDDDVDLIRQRDDVTKGRRTDAPFARSGTKARSPARLRAVAANAAAVRLERGDELSRRARRAVEAFLVLFRSFPRGGRRDSGVYSQTAGTLRRAEVRDSRVVLAERRHRRARLRFLRGRLRLRASSLPRFRAVRRAE